MSSGGAEMGNFFAFVFLILHRSYYYNFILTRFSISCFQIISLSRRKVI